MDSAEIYDWCRKTGICNGGSPLQAMMFIGETCARMRGDDAPLTLHIMQKMVRERPDDAAMALLYMLELIGVAEHGGSVWASWLTDLGEQLTARSGNGTDTEPVETAVETTRGPAG